MFREGLNRLLSTFGREDPFLRVGVLSEPEIVKVAGTTINEFPHTLLRVVIAVALATMRLDLREGTPWAVQGAHFRFASEQLAALA